MLTTHRQLQALVDLSAAPACSRCLRRTGAVIPRRWGSQLSPHNPDVAALQFGPLQSLVQPIESQTDECARWLLNLLRREGAASVQGDHSGYSRS